MWLQNQDCTASVPGQAGGVLQPGQHDEAAGGVHVCSRGGGLLGPQRVRRASLHDGHIAYGHEVPGRLLLTYIQKGMLFHT